MAIHRAFLESEGIECFTKDELTVQVYNYASNAIGGIKLQVRADDVVHAKHALLRSGYLRASHRSNSTFWQKLQDLTEKIPVLSKFPLEFRLVLLLGATLTAVVLVLMLVLN